MPPSRRPAPETRVAASRSSPPRVKELAAQTVRATETISDQVATIQKETHRAVDVIQAITASVLDLRTIATSVAASMEEQRR